MKFRFLSLIILFFSYLHVAYAIPFFSITTSTNYKEIPINTADSVTYQVLNASGIPAKNIVYDVAYPNNVGVSIDPTGTTCGSFLQVNEACILKLQIAAGSSTRTFKLSPRVCVQNGVVCSVPDTNNQTLVVIIIPTPPPVVIIPFILNVDTISSDQHLQFRALTLLNNGTESATLTNVTATVSDDIQDQIQVCNSTTNCSPPSGSAGVCTNGTKLAAGGTCLIWFRSLDLANQPLGHLEGTIHVTIQSDHLQTLNKDTFTVSFANHLYAGGAFTAAGGVANTLRIAKWDGTLWAPLSTGVPNNEVNALVIYSGDLYLGGDFTNVSGVSTNNRVVRWDGISFNPLDSGIPNNIVNALTVYNDTLIIAGVFTNAGGPDGDRIVSWSGSTFNPLATGISNNIVNAVNIYQGDLAVGGGFIDIGSPNGDRIIRWNGTSFNPFSTGISNGTVFALATIGNTLYVGGSFTDQFGATGDRIISWNGVAFSPLSLVTAPNNIVRALTNYGGNLILGGFFTNLGSANGDRIVSWDGANYNALSTGIADGAVFSLAVAQNTLLFAGGTFTNPASRVAQWNGAAWSALGTGTNNAVNTLYVASSLELQ